MMRIIVRMMLFTTALIRFGSCVIWIIIWVNDILTNNLRSWLLIFLFFILIFCLTLLILTLIFIPLTNKLLHEQYFPVLFISKKTIPSCKRIFSLLHSHLAITYIWLWDFSFIFINPSCGVFDIIISIR